MKTVKAYMVKHRRNLNPCITCGIEAKERVLQARTHGDDRVVEVEIREIKPKRKESGK